MGTVAAPNTILPPCSVGSKSRAAGTPPINTVGEPIMMLSGTGDTQRQWLPSVAAGYLFGGPRHPGQKLAALVLVVGQQRFIIEDLYAVFQFLGSSAFLYRNCMFSYQPFTF